MQLTPTQTYFLVGYLDDRCSVPFMQTLVFLRSTFHQDQREHIFADAIAWYGNQSKEQGLNDEDTIVISERDLETIKDLRGLVEELGRIS